jgi:hypothetical protein
VEKDFVALRLFDPSVYSPMNEHFDLYEVDSKVNCQMNRRAGGGGKGVWWCYQDWMIEGTSESTYPPFSSPIAFEWIADVTKFSPNLKRADDDDDDKKRSSTMAEKRLIYRVTLGPSFEGESCDVSSYNIVSSDVEVEGRMALYSDSAYENEVDYLHRSRHSSATTDRSSGSKLVDDTRIYAALKLFIKPEQCRNFVATIDSIRAVYPIIEVREGSGGTKEAIETGTLTDVIYEKGQGEEEEGDEYKVKVETDPRALCIPKISWNVVQKAPPARITTFLFEWSVYYVPDSTTNGRDNVDVPVRSSSVTSERGGGGGGGSRTASLLSVLEVRVSSRPEERYKIMDSTRAVNLIDEVKHAVFKLKPGSQQVDVLLTCKRGYSWALKRGKCIEPSNSFLESAGGGDGGGGWDGNGIGQRYWHDQNGVEVVFPGLHGHWDQWWWMWAIFFVVFIIIVIFLLWCACYEGWGDSGGGGNKKRKHKHHQHHQHHSHHHHDNDNNKQKYIKKSRGDGEESVSYRAQDVTSGVVLQQKQQQQQQQEGGGNSS